MDRLQDEVEMSIGNVTFVSPMPPMDSALKPVIDYLLIGILVVIMLAMGSEITWETLSAHMRRPIGIGIGMVSQFCVMPLSAYALTQAMGLSNLHSIGILIISCCPGGPLSNTFAYFCDGDVSLSVAMTSISNLVALGMMPLNLWIYGRSFQSDDLVIPYDKLALSLVMVTAPVAVGMLLRWRHPVLATYVTKIGSYVGIAILVVFMVLEVVVFPDMFTGVDAKLYACVFVLPLVGLTLGFAMASVFRQEFRVRKTISFECGIQNVPTAITTVSLSFAPEVQKDIILLPWLYFFAMISGSTVFCFAYQIYKKCKLGKSKKKKVMSPLTTKTKV